MVSELSERKNKLNLQLEKLDNQPKLQAEKKGQISENLRISEEEKNEIIESLRIAVRDRKSVV